MANETAYLAGKAVRKIPPVTYAIAAGIAAYWLWPQKPPAAAPTPTKVITASEQRCHTQLDGIIKESQSLLSAGKSLDAYNTARPCAIAIKDATLIAIETRALMAHKLDVAKNSKETAAMRLSAIDSLERMGEPSAASLTATKRQLQATIDREQKSTQQAIAREKKKQGVSVGMTPADAIASSWGYPQNINRTTNARGTREQWVYPGGGYLYFDNDVLTAISTRH